MERKRELVREMKERNMFISLKSMFFLILKRTKKRFTFCIHLEGGRFYTQKNTFENLGTINTVNLYNYENYQRLAKDFMFEVAI